MRKGRRFIPMAVVFCLATPMLALSAPDCRPSPERPYVCDIGEPRTLTPVELERLVETDAALRATIARIGYPDLVQVQKIKVEAPWLNWEVRVYYRDFDQMMAFGRAFVLGDPKVSLMRYQGPIPPAMAARTP